MLPRLAVTGSTGWLGGLVASVRDHLLVTRA
jgi:hypothetical protein